MLDSRPADAAGRLDRRTIELVYRAILGRPPEREAVYQYHLAHGTFDNLRLALLFSAEFDQVRSEAHQRAVQDRRPSESAVSERYFPVLDRERLADLTTRLLGDDGAALEAEAVRSGADPELLLKLSRRALELCRADPAAPAGMASALRGLAARLRPGRSADRAALLQALQDLQQALERDVRLERR